MKVSKNLIASTWKEAGLKPHRLDRYMASSDRQFAQEAAARATLSLSDWYKTSGRSLGTPYSRAKSSTERPASTCFSATMICASLCLLLLIRFPLSFFQNRVPFRTV
jgi:hypothetical protein